MTKPFGPELDFWKMASWENWSPGWRVSVEQYIRDVAEKLRDHRVIDIKPVLMKELEVGLRAMGNSKKTVRTKLGIIKSVLNHSVECERIPYNPIARYQAPKGDPADIEFWELAEVESFLSFAKERSELSTPLKQNHLAYLTALNTGVRAGELWAMRVSSLRASLGIIQVTEPYHVVSKEFRGLKSKQGRPVPLNSFLMSELQAWIADCGLSDRDLLFTTEARTPIDHNNFSDRVFKKDLKTWGGRQITFHGLRHTAATLMLDQGVDIRTLQRILGHKDVQSTERYVPALGRKVQEAGETFRLRPAVKPKPETKAETDVEKRKERHRFSKTNGITEGLHNKMEMISRHAYGFRNFENYRLRVRVLCG